MNCKNCRATIPLLKTRWLCKKDNKRVLLTMEPNAKKRGDCVQRLRDECPVRGQTRPNAVSTTSASVRHHDAVGCEVSVLPGTNMTMEDIRLEGRAGNVLGTINDCRDYRSLPVRESYRLPT